MEKLFEQYERKFNTFANAAGEKMPRSLRLFDIKLRLALGIRIDFDSNIAQTKTPIVKDCYVHLIKIAELWNTYEALFQYAKTKYPLKEKFDIIKTIEPEKTTPILVNGFAALIKLYENTQFAADFDTYTEKVKQQIRQDYKQHLERITACLKTKKNNANDLLMRLIYTERNVFYHSGEAVKMGMDYHRRKRLLTLYHSTLQKYILTVINVIL